MMPSTSSASPQSLSAMYRSSAEAAAAVDRLLALGVGSQDIQVWLPQRVRDRALSLRKVTRASDGAAFGTTLGGLLGAALGWSVATGLVALPWLAWLSGGGTLVAVLAGAGGLGAIVGLLGALFGLTRTVYVARRIEHEVEDGAIVVGVSARDEDDEAQLARLEGALERAQSTGEKRLAASTRSR